MTSTETREEYLERMGKKHSDCGNCGDPWANHGAAGEYSMACFSRSTVRKGGENRPVKCLCTDWFPEEIPDVS